MNAILFTAVWGVLMMFCGAFVKSKTVPKYLALAGISLAFALNFMELNTGQYLFNIDAREMLRTGSFNLTFVAIALGASLIYFC